MRLTSELVNVKHGFWIAIEPVHRYILGVYLSYHKNIMVAEFFLRTLVKMC